MYAWKILKIDTGPSALYARQVLWQVFYAYENFPFGTFRPHVLVLLAMGAHESPFVGLAKSKCNKTWLREKIACFRKLVVSSKLDKVLAASWAELCTLIYTMG